MTAELQQDDAAGAADRLGSVGPAAAVGAEGARSGRRRGSDCGAGAGAAWACGAAGTERAGLRRALGTARRGASRDGGAGGSCGLCGARGAETEFGSLKFEGEFEDFGEHKGQDVGWSASGISQESAPGPRPGMRNFPKGQLGWFWLFVLGFQSV